jgi:hypothetical protein
MGRIRWAAWTAVLTATLCGCATGPLLDNPLVVQPDATVTVENPVYIPLGPPSYGVVYEKVMEILSDYWDIDHANSSRYDGHLSTIPRVAPGLERLLIPGSPDCEQRLYAMFQSIRHFAQVRIKVANDGGFFVDVKVFKELEDVPRPTHALSGAAAFRSDNTVDRRWDIIDETIPETTGWIPIGRDCKLEQVLLQRIKKCM